MSAHKKREKKRYEEIKRGKCPEPRKKRKSETRGKNGQVSDVELGVQDTHLRGKKKKIQSISFSSKFQKSKKGMYSLKRAKVNFTIVITIITIHHSFATHAHLDLTS